MLIQRNLVLMVVLVFTLMLAAACTPAATPSSTPAPSPSVPTPTITPAPTTIITPTPTPFQINVLPDVFKGNSIAGQKCVFLVTISDSNPSGLPVTISATAPGASVTVRQNTIIEGQVDEVTVIPEKSVAGSNIEVTITGSREGLSHKTTVSFKVLQGEDTRGQDAWALLPKFTTWLAAKHP